MKLSRFFLAIVLAGLTTTMSHAQQPTEGQREKAAQQGGKG